MIAANHGTRWTRAEDEFLQAEWDGTHATAEVIAELLGRTVNAALQRHYELEWGTAVDPVEVKPERAAPRPDRTRTYVRVTVTEVELRSEDHVCPSCWLVVSASGACGCN